MQKNPQPATKADLETLKVEIKGEIKDLKNNQKSMDQKLDKLQITLDGFVGVVNNLRTDNIVGANQTRELRDQATDHEKRITSLELHHTA